MINFEDSKGLKIVVRLDDVKWFSQSDSAAESIVLSLQGGGSDQKNAVIRFSRIMRKDRHLS
jgi:hypothetical protein